MPENLTLTMIVLALIALATALNTALSVADKWGKLGDRWKKSEAERFAAALSEHCPAQHQPMANSIDAVGANLNLFKAETGKRLDEGAKRFTKIEGMIVDNSPNGSIATLIFKVDAIAKDMKDKP